MSKRISAKVGEYVNSENKTVGEYDDIGVILNNSDGEFILLDPGICLAGVLAKQNALEFKKGGQIRSKVVAGIYENQPKQNNQNNQSTGGYRN